MSNPRTRPTGGLLRAARERAGKTQGEVAAELGVSQPTVSGWENDDFTPSHRRWRAVARAYRIKVSAIAQAEAAA